MSLSQDSDFRILLVGRTGHGKSSTGNTIIGKDVFEVSGASKSKTKTCQWSKKWNRFGKVVEVVDTPGMFDTDLDEVTVHKEMLKSLALTTPGFHVIAFVLMKSKFTEEIQKTQDLFFNWFGEDVEKFACVILTDTDNEEDKRTYINDDPHPKLAELVKICDDNVIALNNRGSDELKDRQIKKLFEVVDSIKRKNGDKHFSNVFFQLVESYIHSREPSKLTKGSIRIIENAAENNQLSQSQKKFLKQMYKGLISTDVYSEELVAETNIDSYENDRTDLVLKESDNFSKGNLQIYDSVSNEKISNRQVLSHHEISTGSDDLSTSQPHEFGESYNRSNMDSSEVPGKNVDHYEGNFMHGHVDAKQYSTYQIESNETSAVMHGNAAQAVDNQNIQPDQKRDSKRNRRQNRVVDPESVIYDSPVQSRDDFKGKVNNGGNGEEELHGLSGFFKKAWRYCKKKFDGCILL